MRAPLSIIIPTLNASAVLPDTLAALMEGVEAGVVRELILSDGGSEDGTCALADQAGARIVTGPPGRGGQIARGVAAASGGWLLILHADTHLAPGWSGAVLAHMAGDRAGYFRLRFRARGLAPRLVAGWANLRARLFSLPFGDQGLVLPRVLYDAVGGMPELPLMEDVAMARALRGQLVAIPCEARTSAARFQHLGWLRGGARNLWTLLRYALGADPEVLARAYSRR
ncbi:TIGR04283 family arsenosugar biosynthesis glycosyltransferase [Aliiroseovarius subalbicans]|uniref:TIGR04283 family arsenosugar biosynthesis glycosyltransferase n=1 Tax=Aliiroseovarius subalbicans TaxID=2925840 RepID=UPI001F59200B|nr:TIGR04283 family arsenosugar biosynthesis glycosyltransferase [Aliiroseovarius subalbicans]MCI2399052.1 TIGR04283 family arsenosugar biosynthesis glycosyltransferase [Aliiroseovarius subalbicans]